MPHKVSVWAFCTSCTWNGMLLPAQVTEQDGVWTVNSPTCGTIILVACVVRKELPKGPNRCTLPGGFPAARRNS